MYQFICKIWGTSLSVEGDQSAILFQENCVISKPVLGSLRDICKYDRFAMNFEAFGFGNQFICRRSVEDRQGTSCSVTGLAVEVCPPLP